MKTNYISYNVDYPSCDIMVNNQLRKLYGKNKNKIYLNDGDYIQLNIFNPFTCRIGVQLKFNGKCENDLLIVFPGQRVILDRFLSDNHRIQFKTYMVDGDDKMVKKAIKDNGKLNIYFWYEQHKYYPINISYNCTYPYSISGYSDNDKSTYSYGMSSTTLTNTDSLSTFYKQNLEETGRIEKGKKSNQKLKDIDFDRGYIFHTLEYKLLPYSIKEDKKKPLSIPKLGDFLDIPNESKTYSKTYRNTDNSIRLYCSSCGYRVRNRSWKFCPMCRKEIF